jgi:molecular chaperone DnaK (HSP70)
MRTRQAGEIAGLEVLAIINEPTAAAIAYGMKVQDEKVIMVYDLGGGTFDVTIIRVNGGTITVVATGGDHHLGGADWDIALAEYMLSTYNKEHRKSHNMSSLSPSDKNRLILTAEEKKKSLTARDNVKTIVDIDGKSSRFEVTRAIFDQITEAKLDETIDKTREVIEVAREKGFGKIDEVLLVGGSSRMLQIKARVDSEFGCNAKLTDPDECVAKGAAIYALNQSYTQAMEEYAEGDRDEKPQAIGKQTKTRVVNVTSKNYGLGCRNSEGKSVVQQMIFANTPLDGNCKAEDTFRTIEDNQSGILFPIYESDVNEPEIDVDMAGLLEQHELTLTKRWPKGEAIKVVFEIDVEGVLHVFAEIGPDSIDFDMKLKGVKNDDEMAKAAAMIARSNVQ